MNMMNFINNLSTQERQFLISTASRIVGKFTAEDIVQNSLEKALKRQHTYDSSRSAPLTWLTTITRNTALDSIRKTQKHQVSSETYLLNDLSYEESKQTPNLNMDALFSTLNKKEATVLTLLFQHSMKAKEIEEETGIKASTVPVIRRRALNKLRVFMNERNLNIDDF